MRRRSPPTTPTSRPRSGPRDRRRERSRPHEGNRSSPAHADLCLGHRGITPNRKRRRDQRRSVPRESGGTRLKRAVRAPITSRHARHRHRRPPHSVPARSAGSRSPPGTPRRARAALPTAATLSPTPASQSVLSSSTMSLITSPTRTHLAAGALLQQLIQAILDDHHSRVGLGTGDIDTRALVELVQWVPSPSETQNPHEMAVHE